MAALLCAATPLRAQGSGPLEVLRGRLDPATWSAVAAAVDSAQLAGLPAAALVSKAQEGVLKRASGAQVIAATHALLGRLRAAAGALGAGATPADIEAGASALRVGATPTQLAALRTARSGRSATVPLVVLTDLLARGVPAEAATRALTLLGEANATDAAFGTLRAEIERDIQSGVAPASAAMVRSRAAVQPGRP
ncbi:MAG: hypothetical protein MUF40_02520 [Gemmatimonadaceae bacterium]|nr:hypothetical protein [Gemmatimonadaceae bacterium]